MHKPILTNTVLQEMANAADLKVINVDLCQLVYVFIIYC